MDVYQGLEWEILYIITFDKNSDLRTTCLDKEYMTGSDQLKAEERFPITNKGYTTGNLLHGAECHILLETETSKWFLGSCSSASEYSLS